MSSQVLKSNKCSIPFRKRDDLICPVCFDVYISPRLLPCVHSVCIECIAKLINKYGKNFPCPLCREIIRAPSEGAPGFKRNIYISDEELIRARKGELHGAECQKTGHEGKPLELYCYLCDTAICMLCKLTEHERHKTESVKAVAEQSKKALDKLVGVLNERVSMLTKLAEKTYLVVTASRYERHLMKAQVTEQCERMKMRVIQCYQRVLNDIENYNFSVTQQITATYSDIEMEKQNMVNLQQQVQKTVRGTSDLHMISLANTVDKKQNNCVLDLKGDIENMTINPIFSEISDETARETLEENSICRFFTFSIKHFKRYDTVDNISILPMYQCECMHTDHQEVHSICHVDSNMISISYGGSPPLYAMEKHIGINEKGKLTKYDFSPTEKKKCKATSYRFCSGRFLYTMFNADYLYSLFAKGNIPIRLKQVRCYESTLQVLSEIVESKNPLRIKRVVLFEIEAERAVAFDATENASMIALVEEHNAGTVLLLQRSGRKAVRMAKYAPRGDRGFHAMDIMFWEDPKDKTTKLLVSDPNHHSVHVVRIKRGNCEFERYLVAGDECIMQPTALNVDHVGRVWIGCQNGWILMLKHT